MAKTINILDNHPEVKKAIEAVNNRPEELKGAYWREAVVNELAKQYNSNGMVTEPALDWADMVMSEYEQDNGQ
jgi:hypothetical protein